MTAGAKVNAAVGGRSTLEKERYTEKIEFAHPDDYAWMVGKTFEFTWTVEGNTWHHVGTLKTDDGQEIKIDEMWERSK